MKQQAVAIRPGWVIEFKGKPWTVTKASHIKPGKGGAFMQVEMKSVEEGTKTNERFRSEDTIEKLMVEVKDAQFLYEDSTGLTFMENETYEQFVMPADILGDSRPFLTDGMLVHIDFIDSKPGQRRIAAAGYLRSGRDRARYQRSDCFFVLQTGNLGQRHPYHGSSVCRYRR